MADLSTEIVQALAASETVTWEEAQKALEDGRVMFGAVGPSRRVWVTSPHDVDAEVVATFDAIIMLVEESGFGLAARVGDGDWVMVRDLTPAEAVSS